MEVKTLDSSKEKSGFVVMWDNAEALKTCGCGPGVKQTEPPRVDGLRIVGVWHCMHCGAKIAEGVLG